MSFDRSPSPQTELSQLIEQLFIFQALIPKEFSEFKQTLKAILQKLKTQKNEKSIPSNNNNDVSEDDIIKAIEEEKLKPQNLLNIIPRLKNKISIVSKNKKYQEFSDQILPQLEKNPGYSVGEYLGNGGFGCVGKIGFNGEDIALKMIIDKETDPMGTDEEMETLLLSSAPYGPYSSQNSPSLLYSNSPNPTFSSSTSTEQTKGKASRERIIREIFIQNLLQHPNIIPLRHWYFRYNEGSKAFQVFLVMELSPIGNLDDYLRKNNFKEAGNQLPNEMIRSIAIQVASAILTLHCLGLAWRDLKPENILVFGQEKNSNSNFSEKDVSIKISDFGTVTPISIETQTLNQGLLIKKKFDSHLFVFFSYYNKQQERKIGAILIWIKKKKYLQIKNPISTLLEFYFGIYGKGGALLFHPKYFWI